jgi:hypothetical protein
MNKRFMLHIAIAMMVFLLMLAQHFSDRQAMAEVTPYNISPRKSVEIIPQVYLNGGNSDKYAEAILLLKPLDSGVVSFVGQTFQQAVPFSVNASPDPTHESLETQQEKRLTSQEGAISARKPITLAQAQAIAHTPDVRLAYASLFSSVVLTQDGKIWDKGIVRPGHATAEGSQVDGITGIITDVEAGTGYGAAVANGKVWVWGVGNTNFLGNADTVCSKVLCPSGEDILPPDGTGYARKDPRISYEPHQVQGLDNIVSLALGYRIAAARDLDGNVWVWTHGNAPHIVHTDNLPQCLASNSTLWRAGYPDVRRSGNLGALRLDGIRYLYAAWLNAKVNNSNFTTLREDGDFYRMGLTYVLATANCSELQT